MSKFKLSERAHTCEVMRHGKEYEVVDATNFIPICPECFSDNVMNAMNAHSEGRIKDTHGADWYCKDCECLFDDRYTLERTKLGKIVDILLLIVSIIFFIGIGVSIVYGCYGSDPNSLFFIVFAPLICFCIGVWLNDLRERF